MGRNPTKLMLIAGVVGSWTSAHAGLNDKLPADAYVDPIDRQIAKSGKGITGRPYPCSREKTEHGVPVIESVPTDQCVGMLTPQRWRGLWRNDFEGSQFCLAPAKVCFFDAPGDRVWLTPGPLKGKTGAVYAVEFVGRRTAFRGPYGHLGLSDYEIIVDRPISIKMVIAPPRPNTRAELIAYWKRCEAAGTCVPSDEMKALMNGSK